MSRDADERCKPGDARTTLRAMLDWYVSMGVDEAIDDRPLDRRRIPESPPHAPPGEPSRREPTTRPAAAARTAPTPVLERPAAAAVAALPDGADPRRAAAACRTLAELAAAVAGYDGCRLKATAQTTVFADGNPAAPLMILGEAPGADEDRQGKPFVGPSGRLLDRMLQAIGLSRETAYITNVIFWRPPGNRAPQPDEVAHCLPFVERHIELAQPKVILACGSSALKALTGRPEGIMKMRGRWLEYQTGAAAVTIPLLPTFHPAYLLRSPSQKREAWRDLLAVKSKLEQIV